MDNFDLDNLKKTWQEQEVPPKYEQKDILEMLNKKSRNYVKYILWISIAEFLLFVFASIYAVFKSDDDNNSFFNILSRLGVKDNDEIEASFAHLYFGLRIVSIILTAIFVYLFYKNYRKINVESNLKKFILQILKFKKTVNTFIVTNIILFVIFTGVLTAFTFNILAKQHIQMNNPTLIGFIAGLIITLILGILLTLLYYRLVYGIIMRRLGKNLSQLQKIEQENE